MKERIAAPHWTFPFCPIPPTWHLDRTGLTEQLSWLQELQGIPQDPLYHAEGDVFIHTGMVVEELVKLPQWRSLPEEERHILFASALLHDIAKPLCTRTEGDGRVTSKGHARKGEIMARNILWMGRDVTMPVPFFPREHIARLVRFHGLPLQFLDKPDPERAVIAASQSTRLDHVALLAEADVRGRRCQDIAELLARIELFREFCQEQRCYHSPRAFPSDHSRFRYFHSQHNDPDYAAYDETTFEVVLMSGLPGAGKDTWLHKHLAGWPVISLDLLRQTLKISPTQDQGKVIQAAKEQAREHLRQQRSFAWNATNITRTMRQQLIELFTSYGARVRIVYLETDFATLIARNRARTASLPEHVIYKLANKLEIPDLTEAHQVEWIHTAPYAPRIA